MYKGLVLSLAGAALAAPRPQNPSWTPGFQSWTASSQVTQSESSTLVVSPTTTSTGTASSTSTSTAAPPGSQNPCASVAALYAATTPSAQNKVPAQLAYDCLNDVPLDAESAPAWLESLRPYIEWQSTLAYLKNPPSGYLEPAVDVWGELAAIEAKVANGGYANEYELEFELYRLFQTTHDGHFRYTPNMVGRIFAFGRPLSMVSVSQTGSDLPKPYVYTDILGSLTNGTSSISAVSTINGEDAVAYLENWAQYGSLQDPDALFNNVMYNLAQVSLGTSGAGAGTFSGGGRGAYIFPGAQTVLTFENGTTATYENFARVLVNFAGITSGADLYREYVNVDAAMSGASETAVASSTATAAATTTSAPASTPRPGYPAPVQIQEENFIGGYYLDGEGYEDIAVLGVPSFEGAPDFQDVAYNFIAGAKAAGKTKLVIDVSANGGGTILQGYNLFLNLFPDVLPYGATRFRAHEAFDLIGETASAAIPYYPWDYYNPPNPVWNDFGGGVPFDYRSDVDINYEPFESWPDKYGPHTFYGDNFTSIIRWNLSDPLNAPQNGIQINNYGNRTGLPPSRPFAPSDIVVLYDGYCASTCTIFSEFMTNQVGIKTIAIGGRPQADTPMAPVGGVRGTNNYPWTFIQELAYDAYQLAPDQEAYFNTTSLFSYVDDATSNIPYERAVLNSGSINVRDGIRRGDESQTPLQFVYDAADCRIWYTPEMTVDVTTMWKKAVDVSWGGAQCAYGAVGLATEAKRSLQAEKFKKRMVLSPVQVEELEAAQNLWTDMEIIKPAHGKMLP